MVKFIKQLINLSYKYLGRRTYIILEVNCTWPFMYIYGNSIKFDSK